MDKRVDSGHQLELDALLRYASAHVPNFPASPSSFSLSQVGSRSISDLYRVTGDMWNWVNFCEAIG